MGQVCNLREHEQIVSSKACCESPCFTFAVQTLKGHAVAGTSFGFVFQSAAFMFPSLSSETGFDFSCSSLLEVAPDPCKLWRHAKKGNRQPIQNP